MKTSYKYSKSLFENKLEVWKYDSSYSKIVKLTNINMFAYRISLNTMTLNVESPRVYTRHGVPISVTGIAQVRQCVYGKLQY